jgi:hypothetical protein
MDKLDYRVAEEVAPFKNGLEHLQAEMRVIRLLLGQCVEDMARRFETELEAPFRGYGITPAEAMYHLNQAEDPPGKDKPALRPDVVNILARRIEKSRDNAIPLPLVRLEQIFTLSRFEVDILLTCLLPECYPGIGKVFGFLQDDATLAYPTAGFLLDLYCKKPDERAWGRQAFHPGSPLRSWNLLVPLGDEVSTPLLKRTFRVDERIVSYLMGGRCYDERLEGIITLVDPEKPSGVLPYPTELEHLVNGNIEGKECQIVTLAGNDIDGADDFVEAAATMLQWKIIRVPLSFLHRQNEWNTKLIEIVLREAALQPAVVVLYEGKYRQAEALSDALPLMSILARKGMLVFYRGDRAVFGENGLETRTRHVKLDFPYPGAVERAAYWKSAIDELNLPWPEHTVEQLAMNYQASRSRISSALHRLQLRINGDGADLQRSLEMLREIMSEHLRQPLDEVAKRIEPAFTWDDLVLPRTVTDHLRAFRNTIAHQFTVYEKWRLGAKMPRGRGVVALFSGFSGTGKTMAAEVVAQDLGINLYRIDLAGLVSKYIGETEKNIKKVFDSAGSNVLLFFDEADSLFGRRTEIKDSHDRYANLEVNYLLQRLEDHDGPVILATNVRKNLDEAFLRRIHFIIEFPQPAEPLRKIIFQKYLPPTVPKAADIDLDFLAKHFEISGGDIKNAAVQAAFMAAEDGGLLTMEHLLMALKREYLKLGKLYPGSQVSHMMKAQPDTPEDRRRRKEVSRLGA